MSATENKPQSGSSDLKDLIGHLLRLGHLKAQRLYLDQVGQEGLTSLQAGVLIAVDEAPGIEHRVLASRLHATKPIMTNTLKPLIEKGLIVRSVSQNDARVSAYDLTAQGVSWLEAARLSIDAAEQTLIAQLGPDDVARLRRLLKKLIESD